MIDSNKIIFPKLNDTRWIFACYILLFVTFALSSPGFARTPYQAIAAFGTCILLDSALLFFYKRVFLFPLSGILSSSGIFLLGDSAYIWPYVLIASLAILSKHFLTINGRHIFNPNNFGLVVASLLFPDIVTITAGRWGGSPLVMIALAIMGSILAYRVRKVPLITTFVLTFIIGAIIRSAITGASLPIVFGPMTGAAFQLFIFYHITDPLTSPQEKKHQIIFGLILGIVDCYLRYSMNKFAPFLALFIITGFYSFFKAKFELDKNKIWIYKRA